MSKGVAIQFRGGPADKAVRVWPDETPPEFITYGEVGGETEYRHAARPGDKCPYHVYVPFVRETTQNVLGGADAA